MGGNLWWRGFCSWKGSGDLCKGSCASGWNCCYDAMIFCNTVFMYGTLPLRWRHNGCDSVSNHQPRECLLRRLIRRTSKKTSKLRVTGLCAGNSPETGEFPAQMASNAENISIWWRHHDIDDTWVSRSRNARSAFVTFCGKNLDMTGESPNKS